MCVDNMKFLDVDTVEGVFEAGGIIGLGPQGVNDDESIVHKLSEAGIIEAARVGINLEDPQDLSLSSTISFGYYEKERIEGGDDGLNWFTNVANDSWAVTALTPITYDGLELSSSTKSKVAHIDTGNVHLKVPKAEFVMLQRMILQADPSIDTYQQEKYEGLIMKSKKPCKELAPLLKDLTVTLHQC